MVRFTFTPEQQERVKRHVASVEKRAGVAPGTYTLCQLFENDSLCCMFSDLTLPEDIADIDFDFLNRPLGDD